MAPATVNLMCLIISLQKIPIHHSQSQSMFIHTEPHIRILPGGPVQTAV